MAKEVSRIITIDIAESIVERGLGLLVRFMTMNDAGQCRLGVSSIFLVVN
jgi:hypothetical protein